MYDYVIVGAGSAGCVLANRLSEDPDVTVCVIEAGPSDFLPFIHMPGAFGMFMFTKKYDWSYEAKSDPAIRKGEPMFCPRGKTLGGSSSINGMVYTRGHRSDYDGWAALGSPGWSYDEILPYFRKAEHNRRGADKYHGDEGPLVVSDCEMNYKISKVFIEAAEQAGVPMSNDFNGEQYEGFGAFQFTIDNGKRCSTAVAYLHPAMHRRNLTVMTGADVIRIDCEGKRAVGVTIDHNGKRVAVKANREVIVSAGAFNSPQLLMLSGIGHPDELKAHGVPLVHALPGVGKNLQEHPDTAVLTTSHYHGGVQLSLGGVLQMVGEGIEYYGAHLGKLRSSFTEVGAFLKTDPSLEVPDIELCTLPLLFDDSGRDLKLMTNDGYSCHVGCIRPKSRGTVSLASANPAHQPVIDFNFLSHPDDMKTLIGGVRLVRKILASPAFDPYRKEELFPGKDVQSDEDLAQAIKDKFGLEYHPVGTCKMGADKMAVVDAELRVHGMEGLRVIDASIMPTLVGSNTNAPTIMIAEKAADMIRKRPALKAAAA
ncbi:choline dehydrogenase [Variovorax sp. J22R24]|uniref:GMC family oxidoreductase n=1 Tax=Variovorax gracilis TaxID=3053502 RepID=UPI0025754CBC|nr:choline dehydrogenase [Variovorax sp. J22R24]MDM0110434.1 choline dehydrogenase [Variovorax sp. J22R24]